MTELKQINKEAFDKIKKFSDLENIESNIPIGNYKPFCPECGHDDLEYCIFGIQETYQVNRFEVRKSDSKITTKDLIVVCQENPIDSECMSDYSPELQCKNCEKIFRPFNVDYEPMSKQERFNNLSRDILGLLNNDNPKEISDEKLNALIDALTAKKL